MDAAWVHRLRAPLFPPAHARAACRRSGNPRGIAGPLLIYLNHPSWWDPITCLLLAKELLPERSHYAPIDAAALARYGFFAKLGFYPVAHSVAGTRVFLAHIAGDPQRSTGLPVDHCARKVRRRTRASALCCCPGSRTSRTPDPSFTAVPLALEYCFFEERKPEVLASFGPPIASHGLERIGT